MGKIESFDVGCKGCPDAFRCRSENRAETIDLYNEYCEAGIPTVALITPGKISFESLRQRMMGIKSNLLTKVGISYELCEEVKDTGVCPNSEIIDDLSEEFSEAIHVTPILWESQFAPFQAE